MPLTQEAPQNVWLFEVEPEKWIPFAPEDSALIETEFSKGCPSVQVKLRDIDYLLDFQKLSRKNVVSGSERKLKRVPLEQVKDIAVPPMMPPPMPPITGPTWLFCDEQGNYIRISPEDSDAVEAVYATGQTTGKVTLRGVEYELDFGKWKRKNVGSGSERAVRRVDPKSLPPFLPAEPGVMWVLKDDNQFWVPYNPDDKQIIEEAYNKNNKTGTTTVSLLGGQATYELDFTNMTTTNQKSKSQRTLARLVDGKPDPAVK